MNISEVNIVPIKPNNGHIGFASFILNNALYVGNVAIFTRMDGQGLRLVYPKKGGLDCVHPISKEFGQELCEAVEQKYNETFSNNLTETNDRSFCTDSD